MNRKNDRRAKGTGSIRERSRGKWELRYDGPPDDGDKRKKVYESVQGSRRDAERVTRERLGVVDAGSFVPKSRELTAEYMDRWLETYAAMNTRARTVQGYKHYVNRHIKPALGATPVQDLRPQQVQALYSGMLKRGLAPRTVLHCHRVLKQALGQAVKWGELVRNPAAAATPPKPRKTQVKPWDSQTFSKFLQAAKDSLFRDVYQLAVHTGLRRSELCGLMWSEVDLDLDQLQVARTLQRLDGMGLVEDTPKRDSSRRTIALSDGAMKILRRVKVEQLERQLYLGDAWQGRGHVFTGADGSPISGERLSKDFAKVRRSADLPYLTLHGLRHTAVSLLIAAGVHPRVIADFAGHSSISITMDTYGHLMKGVQSEAVAKIDEMLADGAG